MATSLASLTSNGGAVSSRTLEMIADGRIDDNIEYKAMRWSAPVVFPVFTGRMISFAQCSSFPSSELWSSKTWNKATAFERVDGLLDLQLFIIIVMSLRKRSSMTLGLKDRKNSVMTTLDFRIGVSTNSCRHTR